MRTVRAVVAKDLRLELRTGEVVPAMALFAITAFVLFHFGLQRDELDGPDAAGVLLVTLLLAATLGTVRLFVAEREEGGLEAFLLAPVDRTSLLWAKASVLLVFLIALELIAVPGFALLLLGPGLSWGDVGQLAGRPLRARRRPGRGRHARLRAGRPDPRAGADRADARACRC